MKNILSILLLVAAINASAQKVPFEKLDSFSTSISRLQMQTEGKVFKDPEGAEYQLSYSKRNFHVNIHNRLADKVVSKKWSGKEVIAYTPDIDLSKVTSLFSQEGDNGVAFHRLEFPSGYLKTQIVENGKVINTVEEDYLEFYCAPDEIGNLHKQLYQLIMMFKVEKGVILEGLFDWRTKNPGFAEEYLKSLKTTGGLEGQIKFVNCIADYFKFKRGLGLQQFTSYNTVAAAMVNKDYHTTSQYLTRYMNHRGADGNPNPEGPFHVELNLTSQVVTEYGYTLISLNKTQPVADYYNKLIATVREVVDSEYIKENKGEIVIDIPGANAKVSLLKSFYDGWSDVIAILY